MTHFLTGACLGRAGFNRKTAYATLAMTLAAEAPDLDVLWSLRGPVAGFEHHRGITHTLIGAPVVALVVTGAVWLFHRMRGGRRREGAQTPRWFLLWCFAVVAVLSHILLDYTNNYGVRPFFPFNPRWYSGDIVFIVEPVMLVFLALGLAIPGIFGWVDRELTRRRTPFRGRGWAVAALAGVTALCGLRASEHAHAMNLIRQMAFGGESTARQAAEPYPINPFHWQAIVETRDYYQTGDVLTRQDSVVTDERTDRIAKPPVTAAVSAAQRSWLGRVYLSWSQFPLVEDLGRAQPPGAGGEDGSMPLEEVQFEDIRFGFGGWFSERRGSKPLSGSVYVAPDGQVEATYFDGHPQP